VIVAMLNECRQMAGVAEQSIASVVRSIEHVHLDDQGLALAGCESSTDATTIIDAIRAISPTLATHYEATSDAAGILRSCGLSGGALSTLCIDETCTGVIMTCGSNSAESLVNPDDTVFHGGGRPVIIGDDGSAT